MLQSDPALPVPRPAVGVCFVPVSICALPLHLPVALCNKLCLSYTFFGSYRHCRHRAVSAVAYKGRPGKLRKPFGNLLLCRHSIFGYSLPSHIGRCVCTLWHCDIVSQKDVRPKLLSRFFEVLRTHGADFSGSYLLFQIKSYAHISRLRSLLGLIM